MYKIIIEYFMFRIFFVKKKNDKFDNDKKQYFDGLIIVWESVHKSYVHNIIHYVLYYNITIIVWKRFVEIRKRIISGFLYKN